MHYIPFSNFLWRMPEYCCLCLFDVRVCCAWWVGGSYCAWYFPFARIYLCIRRIVSRHFHLKMSTVCLWAQTLKNETLNEMLRWLFEISMPFFVFLFIFCFICRSFRRCFYVPIFLRCLLLESLENSIWNVIVCDHALNKNWPRTLETISDFKQSNLFGRIRWEIFWPP